MGLSCPVYELDVFISATSDMPRILQLSDDVLPQMVNLQVYLFQLPLEDFVEFLPTAIPFLNNSCSHLSLYVQLDDEAFDIQGFMVSLPFSRSTVVDRAIISAQLMLISVLSLTTLSLLEIRLDCTLKKDTLMRRSISNNYRKAVGEPDPVGDYLLSMDMESFALQMTQQTPTLGYMGVELSCVKDSQAYWKVIRSSESSRVSLSNVGHFREGHKKFWRVPEETEE